MRLRNEGTLGEGRKTCSLHCERTAPPGARAHGPLSHSHARAPSLTPSPSRMLWEGGAGRACGFLLSFPEKFLERRSPGEAGGWGARGREPLTERKRKMKSTPPPPCVHQASQSQSKARAY